MSRCPNCDTPLHITRAASPVIESDSAHEYRMNAINSAPPKSSEPEKVEAGAAKVLDFQDGDYFAYGTGATELVFQIRGTMARGITRNCEPWFMHRDASDIARLYCRIHEPKNGTLAESLGYTVNRKPTPASDSVKGEHCPHSATTEKDRHGRRIIARNDFAMVVRTDEPEDDLPYLIVDGKSEFYWCYDEWVVETMSDLPRTGFLHRNQAMKALALAAATPLPTANPAASAKGEPRDWSKYSGTLPEHLQDMSRWIEDLEARITKLEARQ